MPGWAELASFSLLQTFVCGTLTAVSFWGVGRLLCGRLLAGVHGSLRLPAECIAGVLALSLAVQLLAMCHASQRAPLEALWAAGLALAAVGLFLGRRNRAAESARQPAAPAPWWAWLPVALLGAALLLAAVAPETRSDELSYHLPATARLLMEGGLHFHPLPWEASILPQLAWHYALAPVFAVTGSAAGGVASAWLALLLALSVARLVRWQRWRSNPYVSGGIACS
jgi:hypothetical protein